MAKAKKSEKKSEKKVEKAEEKREPIVQATTPDFLPAAQNPGGIPVVDANDQPCGDMRDEVPPTNPGGIPVV